MQETWVQSMGWEDPLDFLPTPVFLGFLVAQSVKNPPAMRETWIQSLGWEDPLEAGMATTPVFLPAESPGTEEPGGSPPKPGEPGQLGDPSQLQFLQ